MFTRTSANLIYKFTPVLSAMIVASTDSASRCSAEQTLNRLEGHSNRYLPNRVLEELNGAADDWGRQLQKPRRACNGAEVKEASKQQGLTGSGSNSISKCMSIVTLDGQRYGVEDPPTPLPPTSSRGVPLSSCISPWCFAFPG